MPQDWLGDPGTAHRKMAPRNYLFSIGALLVAMLACNVQREAPPDLPGTITAQAATLAARSLTPALPTASPATPQPSLTASPRPQAPGPTRTPEPTRTRKNTKTPQPTETPTPTATLVGPKYPTDLVLTKTCTDSTFQGQPWWYEDITMSWTDNSNDEDGFRIYTRNREEPVPRLVHTLAPNVTVFYYQISYHHGTVYYRPEDDFAVSAFNASGESVAWWGYLKRCS